MRKFLLFIFLTTFSFSEPLYCTDFEDPKISQGALSNGMRFYTVPLDNHSPEIDVSLVVRKTDQLRYLPYFSFNTNGIDGVFSWIMALCSTHEYLSFSETFDPGTNCYPGPLPTNEILASLSNLIENLPAECIQEIRNQYREDEFKDSEKVPLINELAGVKCVSLPLVDELEDDEIRELYRALFVPSQMAIIISGSFDPEAIVEELEHSFGKIAARETSGNPIRWRFPGMIGGRRITLQDEDESENESLSDFPGECLYTYCVAPSLKSNVMKDLFRMIGIEKGKIIPEEVFTYGIFCGRASQFIYLDSINSFYTVGKITNFDCSSDLFNLAKIKLLNVYHKESLSGKLMNKNHEMFISHFISDIPDSIEDICQSLEQELKNLTLEEFQSFINETFSEIKYLEEEYSEYEF